MNKDFYHQPGDAYIVTGVTTDGRRFRKGPFPNPHYALGINLWRGSVWQIGPSTGYKRKLVKRVWN